jgi:predicted transcriptional regulator
MDNETWNEYSSHLEKLENKIDEILKNQMEVKMKSDDIIFRLGALVGEHSSLKNSPNLTQIIELLKKWDSQ